MSTWSDRVDRVTNDPARIENRKSLLKQQCGPDCGCKQEDAITTELDPKDAE